MHLYLRDKLSSTTNIKIQEVPRIVEVIHWYDSTSPKKYIKELMKIDSLMNLVVKIIKR